MRTEHKMVEGPRRKAAEADEAENGVPHGFGGAPIPPEPQKPGEPTEEAE